MPSVNFQMKKISEASFITSINEDSRVDQCTQTPPGRLSRNRKLQKYHTCEHIYVRPSQTSTRHRQECRPKCLGLSGSFPYIGKCPSYESGVSRLKLLENESSALSLTAPHSLEYMDQYGSSTPNEMLSSRSAAYGLMNPNHVQTPFLYNQSTKSTSEVALSMPVKPGWNGEIQDQSPSEGLSWQRLHMCKAKLKATATTSELLSGFAMVAMVELQINEPTNVPEWLFIMFAVCTTVLVAVHIFALMISTYLLPSVDAISKMETPRSNTARALRDSPHETMRGFIEVAWTFSTVLGLFLFLVEIAILCWVKFWDYSFAAATAATVIVIPVLVVFLAFAIHFYHSLVVQKCESSVKDIEQLENMKRDLDTATVKVNMY